MALVEAARADPAVLGSAAISTRPIRARCAATQGARPGSICVVEDVADLWAIERSARFKGRYHVLGGTLSALDGIGPEELQDRRAGGARHPDQAREVILALNATVEGQTTAHYIADRLAASGVR